MKTAQRRLPVVTALFFLIFSLPCIKAGAHPAREWAKEYTLDRIEVFSIRQAHDGGYVVVGTINSGYPVNNDVLVLKLDSEGALEWERSYDLDSSDSGYGTEPVIEPLRDGGYIVMTLSYGDEQARMWAIRLDDDGNAISQGQFGCWVGSYWNDFSSMRATPDNGFIFTGSPGIVKVGPDGHILWGRDYASSNCGGGVPLITPTSDGNYLAGFGNIAKLDPNGNEIWQKDYNLSTRSTKDISPTPDGGAIISLESGGAPRDPYYQAGFLRIDGDGNTLWKKGIVGDGHYHIESVVVTPDGGMIAGGSTIFSGHSGSTSALALKFDASGNIAWQKQYSGLARFKSIVPASDGGYTAVGGQSPFKVYHLSQSGGLSSLDSPALAATVDLVMSTSRGYTSPATRSYGSEGLENVPTTVRDTNTTATSLIGEHQHPLADVGLTSIEGPNDGQTGAVAAYTISLSNDGPDTADGVQLFLTLPPTLRFVQATADQGSCSAAETIVCELGTVPNGGQLRVTFEVKPISAGSHTITADVMSPTRDENPANQSGSHTLSVALFAADLAITSVKGGSSFRLGVTGPLIVDLKNNGPDAAGDVTLTVTIPPNFQLVRTDPGRGRSCSGSQTITCNLGTMSSGQQLNVRFHLRAASAGTGDLTAELTSPMWDNNLTNNTRVKRLKVTR